MDKSRSYSICCEWDCEVFTVCAAADGETADKLKDANTVDRFNSFSRTFLDEVRKGFEKLKQTKND